MAGLAADTPFRRADDIRKVQPGAQSGATTGDTRQRPDQDARAAEARDISALRREMERRDLPAGPPPAFQLNLLEAEGDIAQVIARIEAARTRAREAGAVRAGAVASETVRAPLGGPDAAPAFSPGSPGVEPARARATVSARAPEAAPDRAADRVPDRTPDRTPGDRPATQVQTGTPGRFPTAT